MDQNPCPDCPDDLSVEACSRCGAGARTLWERASVRVDTLEEFVNKVAAMAPDSQQTVSGRYWFRGQTNATWGLQPSFMRMTRMLTRDPTDAIELEDAACSEFMSKAHLFVDPGRLAKVKTTPCWWALMQHHGAPTRLLDWSVSPYVAAYFASHQDGSENDGAVWCFCHGELQKTFEREYESPLPALIRTEEEDGKVGKLHADLKDPASRLWVAPLQFSYFSSSRMAEQQGRFTMCFRIHQDHECIATKVPPTHFRRIIIPFAAKPAFLAELRRMNITAAALFPGVDGLGLSVAELTSLGAFFKDARRA
jgi:FRG domain